MCMESLVRLTREELRRLGTRVSPEGGQKTKECARRAGGSTAPGLSQAARLLKPVKTAQGAQVRYVTALDEHILAHILGVGPNYAPGCGRGCKVFLEQRLAWQQLSSC